MIHYDQEVLKPSSRRSEKLYPPVLLHLERDLDPSIPHELQDSCPKTQQWSIKLLAPFTEMGTNHYTQLLKLSTLTVGEITYYFT